MLKRFTLVLLLGSAITAAHASIDMAGCKPLPRGGVYPFDYNDVDKRAKLLSGVESIHFTRQVETLVRGATSTHPFPDIAYTLNQIPNHPRALQALLRLAAREKVTNIQGSSTSVECFIKRAIDFVPNDLVPRMTLAQYYAWQGKHEAALELLLDAEKTWPDNPNLAYNIGLLQAELKHYDSALTYAYRAYQGGFPLTGLRDKLKRAGAWREPSPVEAKPSAADGLPASDAKIAVPVQPASAPPQTPQAAIPPNSPSASAQGGQQPTAAATRAAELPTVAPSSRSTDAAPVAKP